MQIGVYNSMLKMATIRVRQTFGGKKIDDGKKMLMGHLVCCLCVFLCLFLFLAGLVLWEYESVNILLPS